MSLIRHAGRFTFADRVVSAWHYLPVEVPPATAALRVRLSYDRSAATLDLGCLGPAGFRGWSGAARRSFLITPAAATPGYLPGDLEPGRWQIVIGLHQVPFDGVDYQLTAELGRSSDAFGLPPPAAQPTAGPGRPRARALPAPPDLRWLAGDLHAHTVHSDGALSVPELAAFAVRRGLDFLAVTDHNTISHHAELAAASAAQSITLLPGQELTRDGGHANALGDLGWIDFREPPDEWLAATERQGGLLSVNHPFAGPASWTMLMARRPPLLEVWHWSWLDRRWTLPVSWWMAWHPGAVPVGGSDWHRDGSDAPPGEPVTWVAAADRTAAAVLDGLAAGRTAISASRDGPVLLRVDGELIAAAADGTVLIGPDGPKALVRGELARFGGWPGPHRLTDASGATVALTG